MSAVGGPFGTVSPLRAVGAASPFSTSPRPMSAGVVDLGDDETATSEDLAKVDALSRNLLQRQTVYSYCAGYYSRRYYILTIPAIILTIAISVLVSLWPFADGGDVETGGRIFIAFLSAVCTVMISSSALLGFGTKMAAFEAASKQLESMSGRLLFLAKYRIGEPVVRGEVQRLIASIEDRLSDMKAQVPAVSGDLWLAGCKAEDQLQELRAKQTPAKHSKGA
mmetsp:Transcript_76656/g.222568  ORF Transcript_76656/g.222568 Transcript_76656/m.222568 type:complete len:223 (-) Transcript_76656:82-750(-)